jgi:hypothetical protein
MAVTIDEMNVDATARGTQPQGQGEAQTAKEPVNLRMERDKLAERDLRLRAD